MPKNWIYCYCSVSIIRKVEDREEKRPQLADLRESGAIEQDADLVVFMREYYLKPNRTPESTEKHEMCGQIKWKKFII